MKLTIIEDGLIEINKGEDKDIVLFSGEMPIAMINSQGELNVSVHAQIFPQQWEHLGKWIRQHYWQGLEYIDWFTHEAFLDLLSEI